MATVCQGVVHAKGQQPRVWPVQLLPGGGRPPSPPHLGHRQHRHVDLRLPRRRGARARLGGHRQHSRGTQQDQEQQRSMWRIYWYSIIYFLVRYKILFFLCAGDSIQNILGDLVSCSLGYVLGTVFAAVELWWLSLVWIIISEVIIPSVGRVAFKLSSSAASSQLQSSALYAFTS